MKLLKKVTMVEKFSGVAKYDVSDFKQAAVSKGDRFKLIVERLSYIAKNQSPIGVKVRYVYDSLDYGLAAKIISEDEYHALLESIDGKTMKFDKEKKYRTVGVLF